MASEDRRRKIREHLARSSDVVKFTSPAPPPAPATASAPPPPPPPAPTPALKKESRKRSVIDHLSLTGSDVTELSLKEEARKKRILEHVRQTQTSS